MSTIRETARRVAHELSGPETGLILPSALVPVIRDCRAYARVQVERCNGCDPLSRSDWEAWERKLDRAEARLEARIRAALSEAVPLDGLRVEFGGDPRGYTVKIHHPAIRPNTWGGEESGYGVEGS